MLSCLLHKAKRVRYVQELTFFRPSKSVGFSAVGNHSLTSGSSPLLARTGACGWGSRQFTWCTKQDKTPAVNVAVVVKKTTGNQEIMQPRQQWWQKWQKFKQLTTPNSSFACSHEHFSFPYICGPVLILNWAELSCSHLYGWHERSTTNLQFFSSNLQTADTNSMIG